MFFTPENEHRIVTFTLCGSVIFTVMWIVFTAFAPSASGAQPDIAKAHMPAISSSTCQSDKVCSCVLQRASAHQALDKAQALGTNPNLLQLTEFDITDEMLADAYFKGHISGYLDRLSADAASSAGRQREEDLAMVRGLRLRAARSAAGHCLPQDKEMTMHYYHASGLSKPSIQRLFTATYHAEKPDYTPRTGQLGALALRR